MNNFCKVIIMVFAARIYPQAESVTDLKMIFLLFHLKSGITMPFFVHKDLTYTLKVM